MATSRPKPSSRKTKSRKGARSAVYSDKRAAKGTTPKPARRAHLDAVEKAQQPISLRLDAALVQRVKTAAERASQTMSAWIKQSITTRLGS